MYKKGDKKIIEVAAVVDLPFGRQLFCIEKIGPADMDLFLTREQMDQLENYIPDKTVD